MVALFIDQNCDSLNINTIAKIERESLKRQFISIASEISIECLSTKSTGCVLQFLLTNFYLKDLQGVTWKVDKGKGCEEAAASEAGSKTASRSRRCSKKIEYNIRVHLRMINNDKASANAVFEQYRRKAIAAAAEGVKMSDAYTLALNYIIYYDINSMTIKELGLSSQKESTKARLNIAADFPVVDASLSVVALEIVQIMLRNSDDDVELFLVEKLVAFKRAKDERLSDLVKLLMSFNGRANRISNTTEETFIQETIKPMFDLFLIPLKPDYLLKGTFDKNLEVDIFLAEFKKPYAKPTQIHNEKTKVGNLMKLMIDRLVMLGVSSPVVRGQMTFTYKMQITKDGEYDFVELEYFGIIRCTSDSMSLPIVMCYFEQLAAIIKQTIEKAETNFLEKKFLVLSRFLLFPSASCETPMDTPLDFLRLLAPRL
ncbi:hypothetical protein EDC96DRAFT_593479 [Choanephora cucurbitarum]|nr:hypothetical protein EDC96DRAFT_593479 [Choanephora cucurbitarum]